MIKVAEGGEVTKEDNTPDELLAGKYKTEEDLNKGIQELVKKLGSENAYKYLEKQMGSKGQTSPSKKTSAEVENPAKEDIVPDDTNPQQEEVEKVVNKLGLDFNEFNDEFAKNGELSEASYKKLTDAGIPESVVNAYIQGQKVILEQAGNQVYSIVGGQDKYQELINWAAENLSEAEINAYNASVNGTLQQAQLAVEGLYAKYVKTNGTPPSNLIEQTESTINNLSERFESVEQLTEAMDNPKYQNDPAYREKVMRKLKNSNIF